MNCLQIHQPEKQDLNLVGVLTSLFKAFLEKLLHVKYIFHIYILYFSQFLESRVNKSEIEKKKVTQGSCCNAIKYH